MAARKDYTMTGSGMTQVGPDPKLRSSTEVGGSSPVPPSALVADQLLLDVLGVTAAAEEAYRAMLRSGQCVPSALAVSLGWSAVRVESACAELVRLGLLRPAWDDPTTWRPVPPQLGLDLLMARKRTELLKREHEVEQGRAAIEVLAREHAAYRPPSGAGVDELTGADAIREAFERIAFETRAELLVFAPVRLWTDEALLAGMPLHRRLLDADVELRFVYLASVRNDAHSVGRLTRLVDAGAQVRTVPVLPQPLVIADRSRAVVPLDPDRPAAGASILRGKGPVAAMRALFEYEWWRATPLGDQAAPDDVGLNEDERSLLHLLRRGDIDEQVARKMGVSIRTVGRMTSTLMARLGARSRFQAGVLAAERGWLSAGNGDARWAGGV
jgi:DNA-binding CsgD family transcriptional regulator